METVSVLLALCEGDPPVTRNTLLTKQFELQVMRCLKAHAMSLSLQWCHNELARVSNHQSHDYLLNRFFTRRSKKHESSASLTYVWGLHRWPGNSPHKGPVTRKMFPFDDVIMVMGSSITVEIDTHRGFWSVIHTMSTQNAIIHQQWVFTNRYTGRQPIPMSPHKWSLIWLSWYL